MSAQSWLLVAAVVCSACFIWLRLDLRRQPLPRILTFVVYAIFFRFVLSAFHPITFPSIVGPLSINALYSVFIIGLGFFLIDRRLLLLKNLLPVYALITMIIGSAIYNDSLNDSIQSLLKWLFFVVIALAVYESVLRSNRALVLEKLLKSFIVPVCMQVASVLLGYSKATENDNSTSYVGGYYHEAVFSVILLTALMLAALHQLSLARSERRWGLLPLFLAVEVMLTNYRTNILSMLLPLFGYLYFRFVRKGAPMAKAGATIMFGGASLLLLTVDFSAIIERFAEIGTVMESTTELIKSPIYYTEWEQDYFSARVYIWSQYIDAYNQAGSVQHLIGLGADSWQHHFRKYAHNTFISYLYELGIAGFLILAYFFLRNIARCFSGPLTTYSMLLVLCFVGFLIMNLGTMPLWQIEGMVLFAILNALAWDLKLESELRFSAPASEPSEDEAPDYSPKQAVANHAP